MKNYLDPEAVELPWVETPLFLNGLQKMECPEWYKKHAMEIHNSGYTIIELDVDELLIDNINHDIEKIILDGNFKTNPLMYHYNESPRIVEAWKYSESIITLAKSKKIIELLKFLYRKKAKPFNTNNFIKGSEQPLHSDYIHFGSIPHFYLVGVWVPLEDIHPDSGPLIGVPKSHKLPVIDYISLNLQNPNNMKELEQRYRVYEGYIQSLVENLDLQKKEFIVKKGQVIIWAANFLHGAKKINNHNLSRKSLAFHYHFEGQKYYNPNFSNPRYGDYQYRDLTNHSIM
jgi:ectoine hydroxylase-related dioxygenase (phytanoyl-CoA dioxygenase family)